LKRVTQRDIHDTVLGLRQTAKALRDAASNTPLEGYTTPTVPASVKGLLDKASYLDSTAEELRLLIPDNPLKVPKD